MSTAIQMRRDTTAAIASATGLVGEVWVDTDKKTLVVNDGSTAGGFPQLPASVLDTDGTLAANSDSKVATQKAVKTFALPASYLDTAAAMANNSDTKVPSQKATRSYVATKISRRNRFVNPCFQVSQENTNTAVTATSKFAADQWQLFFTASTAAMSLQQVQSSASLHGSPNKLEFKCTTAKASLGTSDYVAITQNIEGNQLNDLAWGAAGAKQLVDSFTFKGPAGVYHVHYTNSAANRHYAAPFTISAGNANTEVQVTVAVPGDTSGTWLTGTGLGLTRDIILACGTALQGTASAWTASTVYAASGQFNILSANTNVVQIADCQLTADPDATGSAPVFETPEYGKVLRECQRFYWSTFPSGTAPVQNVGNNNGAIEFQQTVAASAAQGGSPVRFPVAMRIAPTIVTYNPSAANAQIRNVNNSTDYTVTTSNNVSEAGCYFFGTTAAGSSVGNFAVVHLSANARY